MAHSKRISHDANLVTNIQVIVGTLLRRGPATTVSKYIARMFMLLYVVHPDTGSGFHRTRVANRAIELSH